MRVYVKKRQYRQHVRELVLSGKTNNSAGAWVTAGGGVSDKNQFHGAKGEKPAQDRRPDHGGRVRWEKLTQSRHGDWTILPKEMRSEIKGG